MGEIEKARIQRDARRRAASTPGASQAIIRHLGVELYQERHAEHPKDNRDETDSTEPTDGPTDQ